MKTITAKRKKKERVEFAILLSIYLLFVIGFTISVYLLVLIVNETVISFGDFINNTLDISGGLWKKGN